MTNSIDISLYDLRHRHIQSIDSASVVANHGGGDLLGCGKIAKIANASYKSPKHIDYREIEDESEEEDDEDEEDEFEEPFFDKKLEFCKRQPMSPVSMDESLMTT